VKNVYASKKTVGKRYPNGTVVVNPSRDQATSTRYEPDREDARARANDYVFTKR
jgi:hypothetical protein